MSVVLAQVGNLIEMSARVTPQEESEMRRKAARCNSWKDAEKVTGRDRSTLKKYRAFPSNVLEPEAHTVDDSSFESDLDMLLSPASLASHRLPFSDAKPELEQESRTLSSRYPSRRIDIGSVAISGSNTYMSVEEWQQIVRDRLDSYTVRETTNSAYSEVHDVLSQTGTAIIESAWILGKRTPEHEIKSAKTLEDVLMVMEVGSHRRNAQYFRKLNQGNAHPAIREVADDGHPSYQDIQRRNRRLDANKVYRATDMSIPNPSELNIWLYNFDGWVDGHPLAEMESAFTVGRLSRDEEFLEWLRGDGCERWSKQHKSHLERKSKLGEGMSKVYEFRKKLMGFRSHTEDDSLSCLGDYLVESFDENMKTSY